MKRREFVEKLGIGSAGLVSGAIAADAAAARAREGGAQEGHHEHQTVAGPLASATVSFGQWQTQPPLDRYVNPFDRTTNNHLLIPYLSIIKAGGSVNFIISGFHHVVVYSPGKKPGDVNTAALRLTTGTVAGVPLIDDPVKRIYAGLDPGPQPQDRIEVVTFANRGLHLVICGVLPHFEDGMWGYVRVV